MQTFLNTKYIQKKGKGIENTKKYSKYKMHTVFLLK